MKKLDISAIDVKETKIWFQEMLDYEGDWVDTTSNSDSYDCCFEIPRSTDEIYRYFLCKDKNSPHHYILRVEKG